MRNFKEKKSFYSTLQSTPFLIFFSIVIIFFVWNLLGFVGKMQDTIKNRKIAEEKIKELEKTKQDLSTDIANLQTEKGAEESIREKFGYAKEGEGMILIVEDKELNQNNKEQNTGGFIFWFKNLFK